MLVIGWLEETRTDDQIHIVPAQAIDESSHFRRAVLAVSIHLHRDVVTVQRSVSIAGLHRPTDAEVERQADHRHALRHLADGVVGGTIVDDQYIKAGQRLAKPDDYLADRPRFIKHRDNDQAAPLGARVEVVTGGAMHE